MDSTVVRRAGTVLAGIAAVVALVLGVGILDEHSAMVVSNITYPLVAMSAGALLVLGSLQRQGRDRLSWLLFGVGVLLLGLGEATWAVYELLLEIEPAFPGPPDVFYLAAYPVLTVAVVIAPRLAANRLQRGQQVLDGVAMTTGLAIIAWILVLEPMYLSAGESTLAELVVGAAYPVGDVLLIATIGTVGMRRSVHLQDRALWCVIAAVLVTAVGDIVYLVESWSGAYVSGGWVDATWMAGYGLFALTAACLTRPVEDRHPRDQRLPIWHIFVPIGIIISLVGVHFWRSITLGESGGLALEATLAFLGFVMLGRILLTVSEDRRLVDQERKRLIAVVSHELRTPLTAVQGYLDLALGDWDGDSLGNREMIEIARDQTEVVTRIVTDLVATSRNNLHATRLDLQVVDIAEVLDSVTAAVGLEASLSVALGSRTSVVADRGRLAQIMTNLLSNADRYGDGAILCTTRLVGGEIEFAVHDNGPGVPPRYRDGIWGAFERGQHRFDEVTPGSGLGLAIVRSLVQAHGGHVGYRSSDVLGGACFWVRLPAAPLIGSRRPAPLVAERV